MTATSHATHRWQPAPGEHELARVPVSFATGAVGRVVGRRWFRDAERRDIQAELPGWPAGPTYRLRSRVGIALGTTLKVVSALALIALAAVLGGTGVGPSASEPLGKPDEPENETQDFPVLWAAPDTVARSLPWQLDPARRPDTDVTHAVLTDRRLLVLGALDDPRDPWEEVLWETELSDIATVERRRFSTAQRDFRIVFTDGSWCRLTSLDGERLLSHLAPLRDTVSH
ncbi:hypothetical protein ACWD3I_37425 [Streptomyces sp. NPDC002817]|uniref:hypothetical protein n=1 Tax=Streptomyces sp. NPDC088357 TaxID=3154655 RepID=UPI00342F024B